ncbi:VOC family protein [halophilic archaeon]|nr:VOC family protein [halophilic archaeon]
MDLIHICLNVTDVEESVQWYEEQLGFEETWSFETSDGETVNRYVAGPNGVELQLSDTAGEDSTEHGNAFDHFAISVEDVDAAFADIDDYGVIQKPQDQPAAGARTAFIQDPDGHSVELVESLDE